MADSEYLRGHYASLSDEALLAIERGDLVPAARQLYDEEVKQRALQGGGEVSSEEQTAAVKRRETGGAQAAKPDWIEYAACACTFVPYPGNEAIQDADAARDALQVAGIPSYVDIHQRESEVAGAIERTEFEYRVMVPGKFGLQAASVLDTEIFNLAVEQEWKQYFQSLSDEELQELDSQMLLKGMLDRIKRLTLAYEDEIAFRGLQPGLARRAAAS